MMNRKLKIFIYTVIVQIFVVNTTIMAQFDPNLRLYGKVIDAVTLEPIPSVHIIKGGHIASVTNLAGEFIIMSDFSDTITFSHIAYKKFSISVEQWHKSDKDYMEIMLEEKFTVLPTFEFYNSAWVNEGYREEEIEVSVTYFEYTVPLIQYAARYVSYQKEPLDDYENFIYYQNYPYDFDFARLFDALIIKKRSLNEGSSEHFNSFFNELNRDYSHNPSITISTTFSSGSLK